MASGWIGCLLLLLFQNIHHAETKEDVVASAFSSFLGTLQELQVNETTDKWLEVQNSSFQAELEKISDGYLAMVATLEQLKNPAKVGSVSSCVPGLVDIGDPAIRQQLIERHTLAANMTKSIKKLSQDYQELSDLVSYIENKDVANKDGYFPIHRAAEKGQTDLVKILLRNGADVNTEIVDSSWTPIHLAAQAGQLDTVMLLNSEGAVLNYHNKGVMAPLHLAVENGHLDTVKFLVSQGADIEDYAGYTTPLVTAARHAGEGPLSLQTANMEIVEYLLDQGADVTNGEPLEDAVVENFWGHRDVNETARAETVKVLLSRGANVNAQNPEDRSTPLHKAMNNDGTEIVEILLANGAKIEAKDENGHTPLQLASLKGKDRLVRFLLSKGAKVNTADNNLDTPLHYAALNNNVIVVEILLEAGANINARNVKNKTPRGTALAYSRYLADKVLADAGGSL